MAIKLSKGQNTALATGLQRVHVGLGWDPCRTPGIDFDLDALAFALTKNETARNGDDIIFYGNLSSPCGSIAHTGDNKDGQGDGDDEVIIMDLKKIPLEIEKVAICVSIYDATERKQNFGQVRNSYIRLVDLDTADELLRFELRDEYFSDTAVIFAELYRSGQSWQFRALGQGLDNGFNGLTKKFLKKKVSIGHIDNPVEI